MEFQLKLLELLFAAFNAPFWHERAKKIFSPSWACDPVGLQHAVPITPALKLGNPKGQVKCHNDEP